MSIRQPATLVFDVGKTHVKVTIVDQEGNALDWRRTRNSSIPSSLSTSNTIACHDVEKIWNWFCQQTNDLSNSFDIGAISIATHGATAALIDQTTQSLLAPVMDYESDPYTVDELDGYNAIRPSYDQSASPNLPAGLNLGRQLYWQTLHWLDKEALARATLLLYPQYWAWRLTGRAACEITSLGCHTDLWDIAGNRPSNVLREIGLGDALPAMHSAREPLGPVHPDLSEQLGLTKPCLVYPGLHDSNASYVPWLAIEKSARPVVVSTGTWSIIMHADSDLNRLDEATDMLANIDADGTPLATARFMGGREFEIICETTNTDIATTFTADELQSLITNEVMALPSFVPGTGPFPAKIGSLTDRKCNGKALASLYAALMLDIVLDRVTPMSDTDIVIEGSFAQNEALCGLLAALRPSAHIWRDARGQGGVVLGCYLITQPDQRDPFEGLERCSPLVFDGLDTYRAGWRVKIDEMNAPSA